VIQFFCLFQEDEFSRLILGEEIPAVPEVNGNAIFFFFFSFLFSALL